MDRIFKTLSVFNNVTLTKSQWLIIMEAAGCPKSSHLWRAFRKYVLEKTGWNFYTLRGLSEELLEIIWKEYSIINRANVKKSFYKKKARKERNKLAAERKAYIPKRYVINPDGTITLFDDYDPEAWRN